MLNCPECGFVAKNRAGLTGHLRLVHNKPTVNKRRTLEYQEAMKIIYGEISKELNKQFDKLIQVLQKGFFEISEVYEKGFDKIIKQLEVQNSNSEWLQFSHKRIEKALHMLCVKNNILHSGLWVEEKGFLHKYD